MSSARNSSLRVDGDSIYSILRQAEDALTAHEAHHSLKRCIPSSPHFPSTANDLACEVTGRRDFHGRLVLPCSALPLSHSLCAVLCSRVSTLRSASPNDPKADISLAGSE